MGKKCVDHEGREFKSISEMFRAWGVNRNTYYARIERGWSVEEALTGKTVKHAAVACVDHEGRGFESISAMCKAWGVKQNVFSKRIAHGWDVEKALTTPPAPGSRGGKKACTDHEGREHESVEAMCRAWDVNRNTFDGRISKGWTVEEALTGKREKKTGRKPCTDHEGREFKSLKDMCKHWGLSLHTYRYRIKQGWSLEAALTSNTVRGGGKSCTDHLGRQYGSIEAMCRAWGVNRGTFDSRRKQGHSLEDALTQTTNHVSFSGKSCVDHTGQEFESVSAMCEAWGITIPAYNTRIARGWSLEKALTTKMRESKLGQSFTDHLGQEFPTKKAMCEHWHVRLGTFEARIARGWSLEKALSKSSNKTAEPCFDHLGVEYPSLEAMCKAWGIPPVSFLVRRQSGCTLEEALSVSGKRAVPVKDHTGAEFVHVAEMCKAWDISQIVFTQRIMRGWSVEKALTSPLLEAGATNRKPCTDHLGREYPSKMDMCAAWGITANLFNARIRRGSSLEEALTTPVSGKTKRCCDHLGTEYPSKAAMARAWGIEPAVLNSRTCTLGWSLEEALTTPVTAPAVMNSKPCTDHTGQEFESISAMCKAWGIELHVYRDRIKRGASTEEALTAPVRHLNVGPVVDHLGREYRSKTAMARAWGIEPVLLSTRLNALKWDVEKALTTPPTRTGRPGTSCTDHEGREFSSIKDMCEAWDVRQSLFSARISNGWSVEEALTIEVNGRRGRAENTRLEQAERAKGIDAALEKWQSSVGIKDTNEQAAVEAFAEFLKAEGAVTRAPGEKGKSTPREEKGGETQPVEEKGLGGQEQPGKEKGEAPEEQTRLGKERGSEGQGQPRERQGLEGQEQPRKEEAGVEVKAAPAVPLAPPVLPVPAPAPAPRKPGALKNATGKPKQQGMSGFGAKPSDDARACGGSAAARGNEGPRKNGPEKKK